MKKKVLHLVRKNTQLKASFINNQIINHKKFVPLIAFRKNINKENDGGFAEISLKKYNYLDLSLEETRWEKILFKTTKHLSKRQVKKILNFIEQEKIDICHFHYGTDCGIFYPLLNYLKIPSVVSFYGYDCSSFPNYLHGFGRRYLRQRVFKDISAVLAMSPDMKKDLIKAGCPEEKIIVHYYGTDCSRFYHPHNYPDREIVNLLILASLVPQKGHLFLLRSLGMLIINGVTNFHLRVVGTGELEIELKGFVQKDGLSDFITFVGPLVYASPEMMKEYQNADIFIHPSVIAENGDKEGIPGTLIEAMSAAIPVISTYHAGIPYVIENDKNGLLVKEWDINALSNAIKNLVEKPFLRERLGKAAQNYAMTEMNLIEKEKELENIYNSLMR